MAFDGREYRARNRGQKREYDSEYYEQNGDRIRARVRQRQREASPEERWAWRLKYRHGMYPAQWKAMYEEQHGKCYLCARPLPDGPAGIDIDHDHGHCGENRSCNLCRRGLACHDCNAAIGFFGDSPERLRIAADNLERAQALTRALTMNAPSQESLF